jgi:hypothetical protein
LSFNESRLKLLDYYFYLESSFIELTRIIPLENPPKTFSPRLYEILQSVCSQVENISKIISDRVTLNPDENTFPYIYEKMNVNGLMDKQAVDLYKLPGGQAMRPLLKTGKFAPKWWDEYNKSKHNLPDGYKTGNIENVPVALAGLYVLHVMAYYLQFAKENFLNIDCWLMIDSISINSNNREAVHGVAYHGPRSSIFLPLTHFSENRHFI